MKIVIDKFAEGCSENTDGKEIMEVYAGLVIFFISISIRIVLIYFHWYLKSDTTIANINPGTETIIY